MAEARDKFVLNAVSGYAEVFVRAAVGLLMTPFLINKLGVAVYGLVPLMLSSIQYFNLVNQAIVSSAGCFLAIALGKKDVDAANQYMFTSLLAMIALSIILVLAALVLCFFISQVFVIPEGYVSAMRVLCMTIAMSVAFSAVSGVFYSILVVLHCLYINNLIGVATKIAQTLIVVLIFMLFGPSLAVVGYSYLMTAVATLVLTVYFGKRWFPAMRFKGSDFSGHRFREVSSMGAWTTIDCIGGLLYLNIDLVIINMFLGPTAGGYYAPVVQLVLLMSMVAGVLSRIFTPVAYELIAKGDSVSLLAQTKNFMGFLGIGMALPLALLCGLSKPILQVWLGGDFAKYYLVIWLLAAPNVVNFTISPLYAVRRGFNKVKNPALVTLAGGILNLILAVIFVKYTSLGIYGVAVATAISFVSRNLLFECVYSALLLRQRWHVLMSRTVLPVALFTVTGLLLSLVAAHMDLAKLPKLAAIAGATGVIYSLVVYFVVFAERERLLVNQVLMRIVPKGFHR